MNVSLLKKQGYERILAESYEYKKNTVDIPI